MCLPTTQLTKIDRSPFLRPPSLDLVRLAQPRMTLLTDPAKGTTPMAPTSQHKTLLGQ